MSSIQPSHRPEPLPPKESPKERQEIFELQWEINLIGTYVAASHKNGDITHQLDHLKKELASGQSPEKLLPQINQLIEQINAKIPSDKAPFPPFQFTSGGNESMAVAQFAITLEKYLNVAAEEGKLSWGKEETLFNQVRDLIGKVSSMPRSAAIKELNAIIAAANQSLPQPYQLKPMGLSS